MDLQYHHVQLFVDALRPLEEYEILEARFNTLAREAGPGTDAAFVERVGKVFGAPAAYVSAGQDIVEQLITGLGWRITGHNSSAETRSVLLTSTDPMGIKFLVTAPRGQQDKRARHETPPHLSLEAHTRYIRCHEGRQGVGVLAFSTAIGGVDEVHQRYLAAHPQLLVHGEPRIVGSTKILDVFAYYSPGSTAPDQGTVLRFLEMEAASGTLLPGLEPVDATFPVDGMPAYADHWVSNVVDREQFLATLQDTLGFTPKVDFNAGVVAAGEARIESTVTGNASKVQPVDKTGALIDQSQIYLPINNALSKVGHVHLYLEEIGQGVQHLASKVSDLVSFIQRANHYNKATGTGFTFLRIPRSYYGYLRHSDLDDPDALAKLEKAGLVSAAGIVDLEITPAMIQAAVPGCSDTLVESVCRARYSNLYALLRDHLSEETYVRIVRNQILVDIQDDDVLYQIFTSNVLQRKAGEEAPFLEFIERVCSERRDVEGNPKPIRPGCGGFGIRNFLTLFLSIEVSKAMLDQETAQREGNRADEERAGKRVALFSQQLDQSNPILTRISDAMTAEGLQLEAADRSSGSARDAALKAVKQAQEAKEAGQRELQALSDHFVAQMRLLRPE